MKTNMQNDVADLLFDQPDQGHLHALFFLQQVCLVLVAQVAALSLCVQLFAPAGRFIPAVFGQMSLPVALAVLLSTSSFFLSESFRPRWLLFLGGALAVVAAGLAASTMVKPAWDAGAGLHGLIEGVRHSDARHTAVALVLLAAVMLLARTTTRLLSYLADALTCALCLVVLTLLSDSLLAASHVFGSSYSGLVSTPVLLCLVSLTAVAVLRRVEHGVLSIFLGCGMGSRISRTLAPILLVMPFLREAVRARVMLSRTVSLPYETAALASLATMISFGFLLYLASRMNRMEREIQSLSIRDELTGLCNLRGFQLLARQSMRLAQRARVPFSILFIDLDNLKQVNDELGHKAGSAFLVEMAELLSSTFRETDVIGRIGGDEFAVAGQFTRDEISEIAHLLKENASLKSADRARQFSLSFSTGIATCAENSRLSLNELLSNADRAMYQDKRSRKSQGKLERAAAD